MFLTDRTWYQESINNQQDRPILECSDECEVLIIGAGLAGLSTAVSLLELGLSNIIIIDQDEPGSGASGRNGGFVFGGYSKSGADLIRKLGLKRAKQLYQLSLKGVNLIRERSKKYQIDCDINNGGVVLANWFDDPQSMLDYQQIQSQLGQKLDYLSQQELNSYVCSHRYTDGLFEADAFHFNPLKYCLGLVKVLTNRGVKVFAKTPATHLEQTQNGWCIRTKNGNQIKTKQVVISGGGYQNKKPHAQIARSVLPISTFVAVTQPLGDVMQELIPGQAAVYDTRFAFDYYRPVAEQRILWGGRVGIRFPETSKIARWMQADLKKVFPQMAEVEMQFAWGGWMSYARHEMPQLGQCKPGLWYAQGFGGHGMATTSIAGELIAEAMLNPGQKGINGFDKFPLSYSFGKAGQYAAQLLYWFYQMRDRIRSI